MQGNTPPTDLRPLPVGMIKPSLFLMPEARTLCDPIQTYPPIKPSLRTQHVRTMQIVRGKKFESTPMTNLPPTQKIFSISAVN